MRRISMLSAALATLAVFAVPVASAAESSPIAPPVFSFHVGGAGDANGEFGCAHGIDVGSRDGIYIADGAGARVQKFNKTGVYVNQWGDFGTADGEFGYPTGLAVNSSDQVIVVDRDLDRVQMFESDGTFVRKFGATGTGDGQFDSPFAVAVDSNDRIIVGDTGNDRIQVFDSTGGFLFAFGSTGSETFGEKHFIWKVAVSEELVRAEK